MPKGAFCYFEKMHCMMHPEAYERKASGTQHKDPGRRRQSTAQCRMRMRAEGSPSAFKACLMRVVRRASNIYANMQAEKPLIGHLRLAAMSVVTNAVEQYPVPLSLFHPFKKHISLSAEHCDLPILHDSNPCTTLA